MKRIATLTLMLMLMVLTVTSCSTLGLGKQQEKTDASSSSQMDSSAGSQMDASDKSKEEQKQKDTKVVQGTINKIDTYLVLLTDDGEYQVMDYGEGVTVDEFMEGDKVAITYTGELGDEANSPVIVAIEKAK